MTISKFFLVCLLKSFLILDISDPAYTLASRRNSWLANVTSIPNPSFFHILPYGQKKLNSHFFWSAPQLRVANRTQLWLTRYLKSLHEGSEKDFFIHPCLSLHLEYKHDIATTVTCNQESQTVALTFQNQWTLATTYH